MSSWLKHLRDFRSNERGNIVLLFGLTLVPVVGAAGAAVDYSTASNMRTALQAEVDAASLEAVKAAVMVQINPGNSTKTASERQTLVDAEIARVLTVRSSIAGSRTSISGANFAFTGEWADSLKTEYRITASSNVKKYFKLPTVNEHTYVAVSATAAMKYDAVLKSSAPTMKRPGYNAGDYNRIYAYCYNKNEPDVSKRRTQMTAVASNGESSSNVFEVNTNPIFSNIKMPECDVDKGETMSWRLYNIRGARTTPSRWPTDSYDSATKIWTQTDKASEDQTSTNPTVRELYNHYSDTLVDPDTKLETFQFRGDQMGYNAPINIMETVVCNTVDQCDPYVAGSIVPQGSNRTPTPATTKCEPGKFMFIGFEDRPYIPGRPNGQYSDWNSGYWTDRDYEDVTFIVSCPSVEITGYTQKIWLHK
jgi:Flp pilus assembly protein TadG